MRVVVQPCERRVFPDAAYLAAGAEIGEDLSEAAAILGVKQVPTPYTSHQAGPHTLHHTRASFSCTRLMVNALLE